MKEKDGFIEGQVLLKDRFEGFDKFRSQEAQLRTLFCAFAKCKFFFFANCKLLQISAEKAQFLQEVCRFLQFSQNLRFHAEIVPALQQAFFYWGWSLVVSHRRRALVRTRARFRRSRASTSAGCTF